MDLLLQGIQHLGRLYFSESDSPAESSQKLRVLSKYGSCDANLVGKLSGESFLPFALQERKSRSDSEEDRDSRLLPPLK